MRSRPIAALAVLTLLVAACGDDDDAGRAGDASVVDAPESADESADGDGDDGAAESPAPGGSGTATVVLDNGETYTSSVTCILESTESGVDGVMQTFLVVPTRGDVAISAEGLGDFEKVSIIDDESKETIYEANTDFGGLDLSNDGSSLTGTGGFSVADDPTADPIPGEIDIQC